jgi:O-antigen/teichoic acid export membrane protein
VIGVSLRRRVFTNAASSVLQVLVSGLLLLVLYWYLRRELGAELLGVWAVTSSTVLVARIGELGISSGIVRYVSRYLSRGEDSQVCNVIYTGFLSICLLAAIAVAALYPVFRGLLGWAIPEDSLGAALDLLPSLFLYFWCTAVGGVYMAGLDGLQRFDLRNIVVVFGHVVNLCLVIAAVPYFGLLGVGLAQATGGVTVMVVAWLALHKVYPVLMISRVHWDTKLAKELLGYGAGIQVISISSMLFEPVVKAYLARFGGLAFAANYEMASRMIVQIRALVVNAATVLVPVIAGMGGEKKKEEIRSIYSQSLKLMLVVCIPLFSFVIAMAPFISELWLGQYDDVFVALTVVVGIGWMVNTFVTPAYVANLGTGELYWNVVGYVAIGIINAGLGYVLGISLGGAGVILGWLAALVTGSFIIVIAYHHSHRFSVRNVVHKEDALLIGGGGLGASFAYLISGSMPNDMHPGYIALLSAMVFMIFVWHPIRAHSGARYIISAVRSRAGPMLRR